MRETFNDVLIRIVQELGGSKRVGPALWPDKPIHAAQKRILDSLNEERPARLAPEDLERLLGLAAAEGVHLGMEYLCRLMKYEKPVPVDRAEDMPALLQQYREATSAVLALGNRIEERLAGSRPTQLRSAA